VPELNIAADNTGDPARREKADSAPMGKTIINLSEDCDRYPSRAVLSAMVLFQTTLALWGSESWA
jgi:hypothetical protein